jgi:hypothetical protein
VEWLGTKRGSASASPQARFRKVYHVSRRFTTFHMAQRGGIFSPGHSDQRSPRFTWKAPPWVKPIQMKPFQRNARPDPLRTSCIRIFARSYSSRPFMLARHNNSIGITACPQPCHGSDQFQPRIAQMQNVQTAGRRLGIQDSQRDAESQSRRLQPAAAVALAFRR